MQLQLFDNLCYQRMLLMSYQIDQPSVTTLLDFNTFKMWENA